MLLVHKPPSFNLHASPVRHRRHPSSPPAVLVQPTQTPGLLSLSKPLPKPPQQQQQQRPPRQPQRPKVVPTTPTPRSAKDKHATPPSRYLLSLLHRFGPVSNAFIRSTPSQAEGPSDPFLLPPHSNSKPRNPRRRQPISIPVPSAPFQPPTARSAPLPHHRPAKRTVAPEPLLPAFNFPVCDDMSDNDLSSDAPPPVTPTRPKQHHHRPSPPQHPQPVSPAPASKHRPRNHKRAPSDSGMVFNMSSDESGPEAASDEINALFRKMALARKGMRTPPPAQRERMYEAMAQREVQGYFASSSFQNSPSPEELPDPESHTNPSRLHIIGHPRDFIWFSIHPRLVPARIRPLLPVHSGDAGRDSPLQPTHPSAAFRPAQSQHNRSPDFLYTRPSSSTPRGVCWLS
ncbi:hypothetical protein C0995_008238 [Termitomyces sp. Mi166|nr:hypothetical protein C0995_008238 [Termitomyces sp. Mi166\